MEYLYSVRRHLSLLLFCGRNAAEFQPSTPLRMRGSLALLIQNEIQKRVIYIYNYVVNIKSWLKLILNYIIAQYFIIKWLISLRYNSLWILLWPEHVICTKRCQATHLSEFSLIVKRCKFSLEVKLLVLIKQTTLHIFLIVLHFLFFGHPAITM